MVLLFLLARILILTSLIGLAGVAGVLFQQASLKGGILLSAATYSVLTVMLIFRFAQALKGGGEVEASG